MTTAADASAAPVEITLGGKPYKMAPLTRADRAEFDRFLQAREIQAARASLTPDTPEMERRETLDVAMGRAQRVGMASAEGIAYLGTLEGVSRLLWLGLRHNHADLTPDAVQALLEPAAIEASMDAFDLLNIPAGRLKKKHAPRPAQIAA